MSEMAELPNRSVGDNGVAGSGRMEMSELMDVGINEWMGCMDIKTVRFVGVPMPRTTNHVVMSFDSEHKLLTNVGASRVRQSPVTVRGRTIVGGTVQVEVRPERSAAGASFPEG